MVGTNTNIYVSITGPRESSHHEGYRRPLHSWLISVEPHHTHVPGTSHKDHEPIHYSATKNAETGVYTLTTDEVSKGPGIIGNILIVESAHTSPEKFREILEEELGPSSPIAKSKNQSSSNDDVDDDEPEGWIRRVLHGLQQRKISQTFDIEEFIMFAHGYVANRLENETPALIPYPKIHKDHEKKSSKHKFWVSNPMASRTKTNSSGEALKYGGLM